MDCMTFAVDLVKDLEMLPQLSLLNATVTEDSPDFESIGDLPWAALIVVMVMILSHTKVRAHSTCERKVS